jgi:hypothetical protein
VNKIRLTKEQLFQLVVENSYSVSPEQQNAVRCVDGNYPNEKDLPVITFPGGDLGILAMIYASAQSYGFEIDFNRVINTLLGISGGIEKFSCYKSSTPSSLSEMIPFYSDVEIDESLQQSLIQVAEEAQKKSRMVHERPTESAENALVTIKGFSGLYPQASLDTENGAKHIQIYVQQQTLLDARNKKTAKLLLENNAITLFEGCDQEYLYEVFAEMSDYCFYYGLQKEIKQIPLYTVQFTDLAHFEIQEM